MAGEQLLGQDRKDAQGDLFGLVLHRAVAEGVVLMARSTEGKPEHDHWTAVAGRAVPLAAEYVDGVKERRAGVETDIADEPETVSILEETQLKLDRLAQIETEAAQLRSELGL